MSGVDVKVIQLRLANSEMPFLHSLSNVIGHSIEKVIDSDIIRCTLHIDQYRYMLIQSRAIRQLEQQGRFARTPLTIENNHRLGIARQIITQKVHILFATVEHLAVLGRCPCRVWVGDVAKLLMRLAQL